MLGEEGKRVGLQEDIPLRTADLEFVMAPLGNVGKENLPDAGRNHFPHEVNAAIPVVEIPHHADALGIGGPDREMRAAHPAQFEDVGAEFFIDLVMSAFVEEIDVHLPQHRTEGIDILLAPRLPGVVFHLQHVVERLVHPAQDRLEESVRMDFFQRKPPREIRRIHDGDLGRVRPPGPPEISLLEFPDAENLERIAVPRLDQRIKVIVWQRGGIHGITQRPERSDGQLIWPGRTL